MTAADADDHAIRNKTTKSYSKSRMLIDHVEMSYSPVDINAMKQVVDARPKPIREYDQIPMVDTSLLRQVKIVAPYLVDKSVALVGDMDGTGMLLGLLGAWGDPCPARITILDFDERVLRAASKLATERGFSDILSVRRYNVFDRVPDDLVGRFDWFYTNPPYGSNNRGASARLFITRGCELTDPLAGNGCIILPDDQSRVWTRDAMSETQRFLTEHDWFIREKLNRMHSYDLDDDPTLTSSMVIVDRVASETPSTRPMQYAGCSVMPEEIPIFYGKTVAPPFAHYIGEDGVYDLNWSVETCLAPATIRRTASSDLAS